MTTNQKQGIFDLWLKICQFRNQKKSNRRASRERLSNRSKIIYHVQLRQKPRKGTTTPVLLAQKCPFVLYKPLVLIYIYRQNSYSPSTHVCCSGKVVQKPSQCCGREPYNPRYQACCRGTVYDINKQVI